MILNKEQTVIPDRRHFVCYTIRYNHLYVYSKNNPINYDLEPNLFLEHTLDNVVANVVEYPNEIK